MSEEDYSIEEVLEETMADLKEANDSVTWWHNRFKAVQRDYEELKTKINKAIEYLKEREEDNMCCSVCSVMSDKLLEILGDKE